MKLHIQLSIADSTGAADNHIQICEEAYPLKGVGKIKVDSICIIYYDYICEWIS